MARSILHQRSDERLRAVIAEIDREAAYRPLTGHEIQHRKVALAILEKRERQRAKKLAA